MSRQTECNQSQPAANPQLVKGPSVQWLKCNQSQPAANPQLRVYRQLQSSSVTNLSLQPIRNLPNVRQA